MAGAVGLRDDFTAKDLRRLAQSRRDAGQVCRLRALAVICDGGSRSEAARIGGIGLQTVRDWVLRFNRHGPDGLIDGKAPGVARASMRISERRWRLLSRVAPFPRRTASCAGDWSILCSGSVTSSRCRSAPTH